jgi:hypothetical protein
MMDILPYPNCIFMLFRGETTIKSVHELTFAGADNHIQKWGVDNHMICPNIEKG